MAKRKKKKRPGLQSPDGPLPESRPVEPQPVEAEPPFGGEEAIRALRQATGLLVAVLPIMLALGRWLWGVDDLGRLVAAIGGGWAAVGGPLLFAGIDTQLRLQRERSPRFEPRRLLAAMRLGVGALVSFLALGIFGVLLAAPLVVVAAAFFATSWAQPRAEDTILTRMIGATIPILLFIGGLNIDERPLIGGLLFAAALSGAIRLFLFRQAARSR